MRDKNGLNVSSAISSMKRKEKKCCNVNFSRYTRRSIVNDTVNEKEYRERGKNLRSSFRL